jgi:tetratricopeptide (TPR) repeat protein
MNAESTSASAENDLQPAPPWLVRLAVVLLLLVIVVGALVLRAANKHPETVGEKRVRILESVLKRDPGDLVTRRQLAFAHLQNGDKRLAREEFDQVLEGAPNDVASLYNQGVLLLASGSTSEAERLLGRVLELQPTHAMAAAALGTYYLGAGRLDRLLTTVLPAADAHPEFADLQYLAGRGFEESKRPREAEARYRAALLLLPEMRSAKDGLDRVRGKR